MKEKILLALVAVCLLGLIIDGVEGQYHGGGGGWYGRRCYCTHRYRCGYRYYYAGRCYGYGGHHGGGHHGGGHHGGGWYHGGGRRRIRCCRRRYGHYGGGGGGHGW